MWLYLALSFAIWNSIALTIVKRFTKSANPLLVLFVANIFMVPFDAFFLFLSGGIPKVTPDFFRFLIVSGLIDAVSASIAYYAIKISPISLIAPVGSFNAIFTAILAYFTLHETMTVFKFFGVIAIVAGAYVLNISDIKKGLLEPFKKLLANRGVQLIFLTNILWAITPVLQKHAIFQTNPLRPLYAGMIGNIFMTMFLFLPAMKKRKQVKPFISKNILLLIIFGLFNSAGRFGAFVAFSQAHLGYVTAIFETSTLFAVLFGAIFFKEQRIRERFLGALIMVLGAIILAV